MLRLHHTPMACSLASRFALAESGLNHEINFVILARDEHKTPAYLAINPRGKVPALETDHGVLTESTAILPYIADLVPEKSLFPKVGTFARAQGQSCLSFLSSSLHVAYAATFHAGDHTDADAAMTLAISQVTAAFEEMEAQLEGKQYLLDEFSVADLYLATYSLWRMAPDIAGKLPELPNVDALQARVLARPALDGLVAEEVRLRMQG